jgi:hypothetical protein
MTRQQIIDRLKSFAKYDLHLVPEYYKDGREKEYKIETLKNDNGEWIQSINILQLILDLEDSMGQ